MVQGRQPSFYQLRYHGGNEDNLVLNKVSWCKGFNLVFNKKDMLPMRQPNIANKKDISVQGRQCRF